MSLRQQIARAWKIGLAGCCLLWASLLPGQAQRPVDGAVGNPQGWSLRRKLTAIILPSVEFHQTTLGDALEFLRQESRRLDPDPDPAARGVNLFLKLPVPVPTVPGSGNPGPNTANLTMVGVRPSASTRITLSMHRLPLLEVLRYVAKEAGLKVKVESSAVCLVPLSEDTEPLLDATFRVSPGFVPNQTTGGVGGTLNRAASGAQ